MSAPGRRSRFLPAVLAVLPLLAAERAAPGAEAIAGSAFRRAHEREILRSFAEFLAIPNDAADAPNIERNARWIEEQFGRRGAKTERLVAADSPPVVFARLDRPHAGSTITFYAHYDGQPVDPKEWKSPPFQPVLRLGDRELAIDGANPLPAEARLYARSAGDDKLPIVAFLAALDELRAAGREPGVNLHFLLEGEEEAGSPHLAAILAANAPRLATDLWILCDGPAHQSGRPLLFFGNRGATDLELTVYGANRGLHSGHYGNWAPNPIVELTHLIDSMRDEEGRILISHYEDSVRPLNPAEKAAIDAAPRVDREVAATFALGRTEGTLPLLEAIQRPALNVRGILAGHVGAGASNTIQPEATASIDFRLVPDQTPEEVRRLVEAHVEGQGYFIVHDPPDDATRRAHPKVAKLAWVLGYKGYRSPLDSPLSRKIATLASAAAGEEVVRLPMLGGSIPMPLFADATDAPVMGLSLANFDDNQHAPNENLRLANLWRAIDVYVALFAGI